MLTVLQLFGSNIFMTFTWYGHLRNLNHEPLLIAIFVSWGIAFFEYMLQVPANRLGYRVFTLGQLKIIQEVITMLALCLFLYEEEPGHELFLRCTLHGGSGVFHLQGFPNCALKHANFACPSFKVQLLNRFNNALRMEPTK